MTSRPSWAALRDELVASGFRPSRRLGQNFLLDENLLRAIVRDAGVTEGDWVLEVGPGLGFLTRHLLAAGARVTAVEVDPRLLERAQAALHDTLLQEGQHLTWIQADVLAGKHALAPQVLAALPTSGPWHLVANLPYAVSSSVLALVFALEHPPASATVLVQREMAERVVAKPGSADWGALSIRLQARCTARIVRRVGPELFWPKPQVESALVRLEPRADAPSRPQLAALSALVERLFQRRRQSLARVLADMAGSRELARAWLERTSLGSTSLGSRGAEEGARAEDLTLEALLALAAAAPAGLLAGLSAGIPPGALNETPPSD